MTEQSPTMLSAEFLSAVRHGEETAALRSRLASLPEAEISGFSRERATAFWLNVYNGYAQVPSGSQARTL